MASGKGGGKSGGAEMRVAVCGLTSSAFPAFTGSGAGKSVMCNRFVRPNRDDLRMNHTRAAVLNHSEFGSTVINNSHFLYWGEKAVGLEDGQEVRFQIIEHTEFVDDASHKPFASTKPYYKRCTQLKLQSGGKVTYIEPDQVALPEEYTDVGRFPDKFVVDGFILCVDVSTDFADPANPQKEFFEKMLQNLLGTKKPIVVAATKFDNALDSSVAFVHEVLSKCKKQLHLVEVSSLKGVNVDLCFLVLAHLIDSKKPKTRIISYGDAKAHVDDRIRKNETSFQGVLDRKISDFALSESAVSEMISGEVEHRMLRELCGSERVRKLIRAKLQYLKRQRVEARQSQFLEQLPQVLTALVSDLPLTADADSCRKTIRGHDLFPEYFVEVEDWRNDVETLQSSSPLVPFGFLGEESGEELLQKHIDKVLAVVREEATCSKILDALRKATGVVPGTDVYDLCGQLGLGEEASKVSQERLVRVYQEAMQSVEGECVKDLLELFMERIDLFWVTDSSRIPDMVNKELQDCPRYKRLERRPDLRKSTVIKHIANLQWPEKGPYGNSHLVAAIPSRVPSKDTLRPPKGRPGEGELHWALDPSDSCFNLAILARTKDNALTLRSDFMNHLSGSGTCVIDDRSYELDMAVFYGDTLSTLSSSDFRPQGAVAVVTSIDCVNWLQKVLQRLWLPGEGCNPPYRGMPLVVVALDGWLGPDDPPSKSLIYARAKYLANSVQCVHIDERPTPQPKRLIVSTIVTQLLVSVLDGVAHCHEFLSSNLTLQEDALNVAVCSLVGEPYCDLDVMSPWLQSQLLYYDKNKRALFVKSAIEKQHRTCTLTFHSALNVSDIISKTYLGLILIYSTGRPASLVVLRNLRGKLPKIPVVVVAMVTEGFHDNALLEEGRELAQQWGEMFVASNDPDIWGVGWSSEFFSKCWFSRFSSWSTQQRKFSRRKGPPPLPNRPLPPTVRHSIAIDLDVEQSLERAFPPSSLPPVPSHLTSPPFNTSTLPRSPSRIMYNPPPLPQTQSPDDTYSNPVDLLKGLQQKKSTLERDKKKGSDSNRSSRVSIPSIPTEDLSQEESEYAVPADHIKKGSIKRVMKSPSMSPPPPPISPLKSPPQLNGVPEDEAYATVEQAAKMAGVPPPASKRPSLKAKVRGYDHLEKGRYDHLPPIELSPVTVRRAGGQDLSKKGRRRSSLEALSQMNTEGGSQMHPADNKFQRHRRGKSADNLFAVESPPLTRPATGGQPKHRSPPEYRPTPAYRPQRLTPSSADGPDSLYSVVEKKRKPAVPLPQQRPSLPVDNRPQRLSPSSADGPDSLYSVVEKKRKPAVPLPQQRPSVPIDVSDDLYSVVDRSKKKPPPKAPKPRSSRSPTPKGQVLIPRSESAGRADDISPKPKRRGFFNLSPKLGRKDRRSQETRERSQLEKKAQSPGISLSAAGGLAIVASEAAQRANSLPRDRARAWSDMDASRSDGGGSGRTSREGLSSDGGFSSGRLSSDEEDVEAGADVPLIPERQYSATELGLEDVPPPLPPRNFNWSDMEDNDEEVLQSDNDLDELDEPMENLTLSDHQAMYASINRLSFNLQRHFESIYAVVNKAADEQTSTEPSVTRLPDIAESSESVYDTLESVVQSKSEYSTPRPVRSPSPPTSPPTKDTTELLEPSVPTPRAAAPPPSPITFTPKQIKLIKQQQKLLSKLEKKTKREAERRKMQDERKRRKEEDEQRRKDGRKRGKTRKTVKERQRYFGSPLHLVVGPDGVPVFVKKCVEIVEAGGLKSEGLYRVSGKKEDCLELQGKFDEDTNMDITTLGLCVSAICSTMKAYFKLLPEPLIGDSIAARILVVNSLPEDSQKVKMHEVLTAMPEPNLKTLHFLVVHLNHVSQYSEENRMSASNLAIVFWPTLMRPPLVDLADPSKQLGWQLVMTRLIDHPDYIPRVDTC